VDGDNDKSSDGDDNTNGRRKMILEMDTDDDDLCCSSEEDEPAEQPGTGWECAMARVEDCIEDLLGNFSDVLCSMSVIMRCKERTKQRIADDNE
jgi:hypothetical protein